MNRTHCIHSPGLLHTCRRPWRVSAQGSDSTLACALCVWWASSQQHKYTLHSFFPSDFRRKSDALSAQVCVWAREGREREERSFCWLVSSQFADCSVCRMFYHGTVQIRYYNDFAVCILWEKTADLLPLYLKSSQTLLFESTYIQKIFWMWPETSTYGFWGKMHPVKAFTVDKETS